MISLIEHKTITSALIFDISSKINAEYASVEVLEHKEPGSVLHSNSVERFHILVQLGREYQSILHYLDRLAAFNIEGLTNDKT